MPSTLPDHVLPAGEGVFAIDTAFQRPHFDASFLVVDGGRAAFIDTGTTYALPLLLGALDALGIARDAVDWVIPTHVHLDHAGGAGALMRALPSARMLVHPRGARHMIDPKALWEGATAVYGPEEMARAYGEVVPVAADRVVETREGLEVLLGARTLAFADTPGHARHHHCIWDERTRGWFTGDCFGLSYPELATASGPWMLPTSTPVQFEPEAMKASIARMAACQPEAMYLTHYSRVTDVARLAAELIEQVDQLVALAQAADGHADRHERLVESLHALFAARAAAHGCTLGAAQVRELLALDAELNAQGLEVWLDRARAA